MNEIRASTMKDGAIETTLPMYKNLSKVWPQWLATLIVILLCICIGLSLGWTSPFLAQLMSEDPPFPVTHNQASWIASLHPMGRLFGAVIGSLCVEYLSTKTSLFLTGVPLIIAWICVICANSNMWLYIFRLLSGASMGMVFSCYPLYIGEISVPSIRGALVGLVINGIPLGTLFGNIMGPDISMKTYGIVSLVMTLCYMVIFPFLPQSPHYYVRIGDMEKADVAIRWYNKKSDTRSELEAVERFIKSSSAGTMMERLRQIKEPKNRRAFNIVVTLFMFMQLSGLNSVIFYMEIIVRQGLVTSIKPSTVVIIITTIGIIFGWIGSFAIDRYGRRILLCISSTGVLFGMLLLALHFLLLDYEVDPSNFEWLLILSLVLFTFLFFGLVTVPSTMLSELFPANLKSAGGFVASITSALFAFISTKTYQPMVDAISEQYVFYIYSVIMAICLIYSITKVPETMGKTLQEIQDMLAAGNARSRTQERNSAQAENNSFLPTALEEFRN